MKLVENAKYGYKWWSVRLLGLAIIAEFAQTLIPVWSDMIPDKIESLITACLITLAMVARFIHQDTSKR